MVVGQVTMAYLHKVIHVELGRFLTATSFSLLLLKDTTHTAQVTSVVYITVEMMAIIC